MARPRSSTPKSIALLVPETMMPALEQANPGISKKEGSWGWGEKAWFPWQRRALISLCDEIGLFGGKGSGKTQCMRGFLIQGNVDKPTHDANGTPILHNWSYVYHPDYLGLILRKNRKDLEDFIARAIQMWGPYGGEFINGKFRFQSGATIDVGHMEDRNAWQQYIGIEYQRIAIDEAGLIADYDSYEELRSCMRSPHPELRCQVMLASNSGGPGTGWIVNRFMNVKDANGNPIPHDTIITETVKHPFTGKMETRTRIWMFSTVADNPIYRNSSYALNLISIQDPKRRAAYFEGKWDALYGSFFGDLFRPDGPQRSNNEPDNACHGLHIDKATGQYPVKIAPWWPRAIGADSGYAHEFAVKWGARSPDQRTIVYREMVADHTSFERMGYEIALATRAELEQLPSHHINLYLSHDAFANRTGDLTNAELIALGIGRVLGKDAVHLPDLLADRVRESYLFSADNPSIRAERDAAMEQIKLQRRIGISIRRADKLTTISWQHVREMMKWESLNFNASFDQATFFRILEQDGALKANLYADTFKTATAEVLPKLQIFYEACPRLIDAIPKAMHKEGEEAMDDAHFKGRDSVDALGHLLIGMRDEHVIEPYEAYRDRAIADAVRRDPNLTTSDLIWINRSLEAEWKDKEAGENAPYTPPRQARMRRLMAQGKFQEADPLDRLYNRGRLI